MKIKEKNILMIIFGVVILLLYVYLNIKDDLWSGAFKNMSANNLFIQAIFILGPLYIIISTLKGSYIQVVDQKIIKSEGFLRSNFEFKNIEIIKCINHLVLGPSLFIAEKDSTLQKKLLSLRNYKRQDVIRLLKNVKNLGIPLDKNCEKIVNEI